MRIFLGVVFAANGLAKVLPGIVQTPLGYLIGSDGALAVLRAELATHPVEPYRSLIEGLVLANWGLWAPAIALFELAIGAALIAGVAVRWAALGGALFALHLQFLTLFSGHWLFEYGLIWLPLLALAVADDGRVGLLAWLRSRRSAASGGGDDGR